MPLYKLFVSLLIDISVNDEYDLNAYDLNIGQMMELKLFLTCGICKMCLTHTQKL